MRVWTSVGSARSSYEVTEPGASGREGAVKGGVNNRRPQGEKERVHTSSPKKRAVGMVIF